MSAPHRPGQAPWPDRPAPIQFRSEPPPQQENPVLIWTLRGLGLLAVAVISGLVWWYINDDTKPVGLGTQPSTTAKTGQYEFKPAEQAAQPQAEAPAQPPAPEGGQPPAPEGGAPGATGGGPEQPKP